MAKNFVITIGRQNGCYGRLTAIKLSELLGVKCYDRDLIDLVVERKGVDKQMVKKADEKKSVTALGKRKIDLPAFDSFGMSKNDKVFELESQVIRELAETETCVILGRCANMVLKDYPNVLSVFLTAPMADRINCVRGKFELDPVEAEEQIKYYDKQRGMYYTYYTDKVWGRCEDYDMVMNTSFLGYAGTAEMIKAVAEKRFCD